MIHFDMEDTLGMYDMQRQYVWHGRSYIYAMVETLGMYDMADTLGMYDMGDNIYDMTYTPYGMYNMEDTLIVYDSDSYNK